MTTIIHVSRTNILTRMAVSEFKKRGGKKREKRRNVYETFLRATLQNLETQSGERWMRQRYNFSLGN